MSSLSDATSVIGADDSALENPSATDRVLGWIDSVFVEAGVEGDAPLKRALANRLASLTTLGPLSVYALDHGAKDFCRWLVEEDQDLALDRLDEAMRTVAEQSAAADGGDEATHRAALDAELDRVFAAQRGDWVAGVKADFGS
ncbi:MAG: hypothetical protein Q7T55_05605 [Solirubrobacteraceae bacterium]|nr:hypothetical protein [Solirubrobacteraceae bacterium]